MVNHFGFIDETGVLTPSADQRFFALGLLKIEDTSKLYAQIFLLKNRAYSRMIQVKKSKGEPLPKHLFEFKFSAMTKTMLPFYIELINLYFRYPALSFCCLLFDKMNPNLDIPKYFPNVWEAYISYSKMLIQHNVKKEDRICIIADYLGKPNDSTKYFETEVKRMDTVYNACMIESHASLYIELVDVLLGAVTFDYKIFREKKSSIDQVKQTVCIHLRQKLNRQDLMGNFTSNKPNYFSVWEFKP